MTAACESIRATIGSLFSCKEVNGLLRIRTPLLYPDGDVIDLYVQKGIDGESLTDAGETLRWLRSSSLSGKFTDKQKQCIRDVCVTHGVEWYQGELILRIGGNVNLADSVMRLAQACSRVADLWFTFRFYTSRELVQDVAELLDANKIRYEPKTKQKGSSGRDWPVDFHTRTEEASAFVLVLSTGAKSASNRIVEHATAAWVDLRNEPLKQKTLKFVSLFDDSVDVWSPEDYKQVEPFSEVVLWSRPSDFVDALHRPAA